MDCINYWFISNFILGINSPIAHTDYLIFMTVLSIISYLKFMVRANGSYCQTAYFT